MGKALSEEVGDMTMRFAARTLVEAVDDGVAFGRSYQRLEETRLAFLRYVNAVYGTCIFFEGPIESKQQAFEAMRISLDAWETTDLIERFAAFHNAFFKHVDYDLARQWRDFLHCPMLCMETHGQTALFLCEGVVFEAVSFGRSWDDMVPFVPDMVLTTLLPFDGVIASDGLVLRHCCHMEGPGVERIRREFDSGKARGIVTDAREFAARAREIADLHARKGLDPSSYAAFCDFVGQLNALTIDTCFPYDIVAHMRSWDADE